MEVKIKVFLTGLGLLLFLGKSFFYGMGNRENLRKMVEGNNRFALELYREIGIARKDNLFFSPFSISSALAMAYAGARGKTEREMREILHFSLPKEKLHPAFGHLLEELQKGVKRGYVLKIASSLWVQKGYSILERFLSTVKRYYGGRFFETDFASWPEAARAKINRWIEENTGGRIKELLKPGTIRRETRLLLANAIYFKGNWASKFKKEDTSPSFFFSPKGKVKVKMMRQSGSFNYFELQGQLQVLELPYAGGEFSMVILLPAQRDGVYTLGEKLNLKNLEFWLSSMQRTRVRVYLPRFRFTSEHELSETLKTLGMKTAFTKSADFSGITGKRDLFISEVVHQAYLEVNEEGTEAAASTGAVMGITSLPPVPYVVFKADHPFIFVLLHKPTGLILFMGRLTNPAKAS